MTKQEVALRLAQAHEELDEAQARIAALTAELAQLKAQTWQPVEDGRYRCECDPECVAYIDVASDDDSMAVWMTDMEAIGLVELHGMRLCKRQEVTE